MRTGLLRRLEGLPQTRLVIYPELHTCQVSGPLAQRREQFEQIAEPLDGPRVQALSELAAEAGVWLVPGSVVERGDDGHTYNTALALGPGGELTSYRKVFPWRPFEPLRPGGAFVTVDIPDVGRIGLAICYDLWFPEVIRHLAWMGAELVVLPTKTSTSDREQELVLTRAAAITNQVYVAAVNAAAPSGNGRSLVVDPEGLVRVQAPGDGTAYLTDVLDLDAVTRVRHYGTCGLNRMWSQVHDDDPAIELPLYAGRLQARRWQRADTEPSP